MPPCNKARIFKFPLRIPGIPRTPDFFETLLLLEFLFDHSEFFTRETRHIGPPCNKVGISNFHLEFQISLKHCSSFSSFLVILNFFFTREAEHIVPPSNIAIISNFRLEFQISLKCCSSFSHFFCSVINKMCLN